MPGAKLAVFADMVVFSNYAIQVVMAFVMLNMIFVLLPRAQVSAKRVMEVITTVPSIKDGPSAQPNATSKGTVEFRDVSFTYPDGGSEVLSHISFTADTGSTVAFIGATGSGKTTLVQLVDRLYDTDSGQVLVGGRDVRDFAQSDLHDRIGYIPQTATLFSGTVATNVAYGETDHEVTRNDVVQAVDIAQADDFVSHMEGGLDARIDQKGCNVSGGQRQRLAIARAVARKPEVLVFDDSFSALDFATDKALREALSQKCQGTTCLMVAQRIGTIRNADCIIVLEHGSIVGSGTHDELMRTCDTYKEIASSQLSKEELTHA